MKIDKENDVVAFCEADHAYWIKASDLSMISVTTLIESFGQPFDSEYWSTVKAIERLMGDDYKIVKGKVLQTNPITKALLKELKIDTKKLEEVKQSILDEWKKKNQEACERGTKIHKIQEEACLDNSSLLVREYSGGGDLIPYTTNKIQEDVNASYPEILLHYISDDSKIRVAGQADLVIVKDNIVQVLDYKTNNEIKKHSYFDPKTKTRQMMKYPLSHLEDCNFWHYALQLSTYAWMIEQDNPHLTIGKLRIIHFNHKGEKMVYEVPYLKGEVEVMLDEYKHQVITKEAYDKLVPLEY